ncbi:UNVERIFIED_CONTAM: Brefeldin A-inhibited guanine nucleotide-exchange protein 5 [Sesamum calycinum]|uniref:Brefeldin A-inhibited guanine nucleotide-exchange protein 5 n=1 Tax=Sesamum calycinum TaxID=2727403 RepID=A0AAW2RR92_9LAMI
MAGGAAGGFVTRAFESMLKECAIRKYTALQSAIQAYFDSGKDSNQQLDIGEVKEASLQLQMKVTININMENTSSEPDVGAERTEIGADSSVSASSAAEDVESMGRPTSSSDSIMMVLANAGHTLGGAEAELVLNPLRLAFGTKNVKVVELALDCLHKLIEYNHLEGDPGLDGGKNAQLFTDILNMVCSSVDNSSPDRMLEKVCKDPQMLVDLYVNYDCDLEAPNLFERMVATLSKLAQGTQNVDPKSATTSQTGAIKTSSLQGLVNVLKSLVLWEKSHRESEKQNMGKESIEEEVSPRESDESKSREGSPSNFEKLKAHKSTIEAVVTEKKYWNKLNTQQKITIMEILFSVLEFAASYNSFANLRLRMHQIPTERPPLNLLRQELAGTCIYLDILQKTTSTIDIHREGDIKEEKLEGVAEEKLVSFCEQVLREASDFQASIEETNNMDIHRVGTSVSNNCEGAERHVPNECPDFQESPQELLSFDHETCLL